MRRADRLFRIIQILRRRRRPVTAAAIADELETSLRTVYRDIAELLAQRIPIRGEAGIGYVLESGFDMPPLMLTPAEVEAAMLGAQWVMGRGDAELTRAATDLIAKLGSVVPEPLRPLIVDPTLTTVSWTPQKADRIDMIGLRAAIHAQTKVRLRYRDEFGEETEGFDDEVPAVDAKGNPIPGSRSRDWRDVERYREMRELKKLIGEDFDHLDGGGKKKP